MNLSLKTKLIGIDSVYLCLLTKLVFVYIPIYNIVCFLKASLLSGSRAV